MMNTTHTTSISCTSSCALHKQPPVHDTRPTESSNSSSSQYLLVTRMGTDSFSITLSLTLGAGWSNRTKHRAPSSTEQGPTTMRSTGDLRLLRRSKRRSRPEGELARSASRLPTATSFTGKLCTALSPHRLRRATSQTTASSQNENWDEDLRTSSASASSNKPSKIEQSVMFDRKYGVGACSSSSNSVHLPLKPSLKSDATPRLKVANKHVHFTSIDKEIRYEVTKDDIKNSWLDEDLSKAVEAVGNERHDMIVSFCPTGRFTSSDVDTSKNMKVCMVRIQRRGLINEMLGQRKNLRRSVLVEQARQKRTGIFDAEEMRVVASKQSKWGVELAKSIWWLSRA